MFLNVLPKFKRGLLITVSPVGRETTARQCLHVDSSAGAHARRGGDNVLALRPLHSTQHSPRSVSSACRVSVCVSCCAVPSCLELCLRVFCAVSLCSSSYLYISVYNNNPLYTPWDVGIIHLSTPAEWRDGSMFMVCVCLLFVFVFTVFNL